MRLAAETRAALDKRLGQTVIGIRELEVMVLLIWTVITWVVDAENNSNPVMSLTTPQWP